MKVTQNVLISLTLALVTVPSLSAQDLSKYRSFALGSSLADVSRQANVTPDQIRTTHKSPALLQEVSVWPTGPNAAAEGPENIQQMELSFYNGALYNITITYRSAATAGLTDDDMTQAISASYGAATKPAAPTKPSVPFSFVNSNTPIAFWEDLHYSVLLSRSPMSEAFQLVVASKLLQAKADGAIADAEAQDREDAPQRESDRAKKEADDLQAVREANLKAFRP